ncbi:MULTISPECIES: phage late control D family protein [Anaerotruncus]|uniref:phage late control D family protein n=1 Tax=Anaerotruncus TaxID=244127 RepID=UPI000E490F3D|nr:MULTISPECIES: phage late control D family protein [Anaerotruncus]RGX53815.1 hypothetical protein DWV16_16010 [Anaerotruncus sp. AF02-27]
MAKVIYNGKDIAADVEIAVLNVSDSCGDQVDAIEAVFVDSEGQWSGWNPRKGDTLDIEQDGYRSGLMWIDQIRQDGDRLALGAVSIPPDGKTRRSKTWENINLLTLAAEKAAIYGLSASFYGVQAIPYARVDQVGRGDFGFLQERARLEGCTMKITDNKLVLYSDVYMEGQPAAKRIDPSLFCSPPVFDNTAGKTYSSCTVSWGAIGATVTAPRFLGPELVVTDVPVSSIGEAQRFAKNLLRYSNKRETVGRISVLLDISITGGNVLEISGMGLSDGRYFVELATHDFAEQISTFTLHKCLEG